MNAILVFSQEEDEQAIMETVQVAWGHDQSRIAHCVNAAVLTFVLPLRLHVFRSRTSEQRTEVSMMILMVLLLMQRLLICDLELLLIPTSQLFTLHREHSASISNWPANLLHLLVMIAPISTTIPGFILIPIAMLATLGILAARC